MCYPRRKRSQSHTCMTKAVILTRVEQEDAEHRDAVARLGQEIIKQTVETGRRYYDLCVYCREKQLAPALVSSELKKLGFVKQRITEINRVWQCSDALWDKFKARMIGFRQALELSRGDVQKLLADSPVEHAAVEEALASDNADKFSGSAGESGHGESEPVDEVARRCAGMLRAAKYILSGVEFLAERGEKLSAKQREWTLGNGWTLKLLKDKASGVPAKTPKSNENP